MILLPPILVVEPEEPIHSLLARAVVEVVPDGPEVVTGGWGIESYKASLGDKVGWGFTREDALQTLLTVVLRDNVRNLAKGVTP